MMWRFATLILLALLSACQPAYINGVPNERSPYFKVPVHSALTLHRKITIQRVQKAAYFQRGRVLPWYEVDLYGEYCALVMERQLDIEQSVMPDEFDILAVGYESFFSLVRAEKPGFMPANFRFVISEMKDSGEAYEVYATVMELRSDRQPDVRRLICADWSTPQGLHPITVETMRRTLGDFFTLHLAL